MKQFDMKKNLLFALLLFTTFISCDERKTVETLTPAAPTVSKTTLISRKWSYTELYYNVDGKKTIISGVGADPNLAASGTVTSSPNNYITFGNDGKLDVYSEDKKGVGKTEKGTWKFLNNETQVELLYGSYDYKMDIVSLSDKVAEILTPKIIMANLGSETATNKQIVLGGAFTGLIDDKSKEVKFGMKLGAK
jgi:hypothetical protein